MRADRRHRGKGREMRHAIGRLLSTNRRREQLSQSLTAWSQACSPPGRPALPDGQRAQAHFPNAHANVCDTPALPTGKERQGDLGGWAQSERGDWTRTPIAKDVWEIPDHWFPRFSCFRHFALKEPPAGPSLAGDDSARIGRPARPPAGVHRFAPNLLYGPKQALAEILMWDVRRHRGKGHEMRHVVGLMMAANWRREQLSRLLMAWLLRAGASRTAPGEV